MARKRTFFYFIFYRKGFYLYLYKTRTKWLKKENTQVDLNYSKKNKDKWFREAKTVKVSSIILTRLDSRVKYLINFFLLLYKSATIFYSQSGCTIYPRRLILLICMHVCDEIVNLIYDHLYVAPLPKSSKRYEYRTFL